MKRDEDRQGTSRDIDYLSLSPHTEREREDSPVCVCMLITLSDNLVWLAMDDDDGDGYERPSGDQLSRQQLCTTFLPRSSSFFSVMLLLLSLFFLHVHTHTQSRKEEGKKEKRDFLLNKYPVQPYIKHAQC